MLDSQVPDFLKDKPWTALPIAPGSVKVNEADALHPQYRSKAVTMATGAHALSEQVFDGLRDYVSRSMGVGCKL